METNQVPNFQTKQENFLNQLENFLKTYLHDKAPFHFPVSVKEFLVKYGPWILMVMILFSLPAILLILGFGTIALPFVAIATAGRGVFYFISIVFSFASLILEIFALPGLFARKLNGWRLAYYAVLISTLGQLIHGEIFSAIIGLIISMYVLFEIQDYYK